MTCASLRGNAELSGDPTNTTDLREDFLRDVARRFRRLRGLVRQTVGYENDALELRANADAQDTFQFTSDEGRIQQFLKSLQDAIRDELLEPLPQRDVVDGAHWTAAYIDTAYVRGWQTGTGRLLDAGVDGLDRRGVADVLNLPVPRRQLQELYTRTYGNLQTITEEMTQPVRETLTRGLAEGWNPRKMAGELTSEIEDLQRSRAEVLARTETINSHSKATLDRYESAGVDTVRHGEWATADDDDVCPICAAIGGTVRTITEMREGTFQFDAPGDVSDYMAGTYPLRPPAHPNCRCSILPVIGGPEA